MIACTFSMVVLYFHVRRTHAKSRRYSSAIRGMRHSTNRSGADTSKVATQAILYSLTFLITWMPSTLWSIAHWFNWSAYWLDIAAAVAEPLQGLWNFLIFLKSRPRTVIKIRGFLSKIFPWISPLPSQRKRGVSTNNPDSGVESRSFIFISALMKRSVFRSSGFSTESESPSNIRLETTNKKEEVMTPFGDDPEFADDYDGRGGDGPASHEIKEAMLHNVPLSNLFEMSDSSSNGSVGSASFLNREEEDNDDATKERDNNEKPVDAKSASQRQITMLGHDSTTTHTSDNLFDIKQEEKKRGSTGSKESLNAEYGTGQADGCTDETDTTSSSELMNPVKETRAKSKEILLLAEQLSSGERDYFYFM